MKAKHWYDYLWVYAIIYFALGFFNILFAWLGMIDFLLPLFLAIFGGNKFFCNHLCGRGQLFSKLGTDLKCSRCKPTPRWMSSKWFRYGFLIFFLTMFGNMVFQTYKYVMINDIIEEHNARMQNLRKYYPFFVLAETTFAQYFNGSATSG